MPLAKNVQGEYVYEQDGQWVPAPRARNDAGQELVFDGKAWGPVGPVNDSDFAGRAAAMSPVDLGVARSKNDPFGAYLREQATPFSAGIKGPIPPGSPSDQANVKAYGDLGYRRPGVGVGSVRSAYQGYMQGAGDETVAAMAATLDPLRNPDAPPSTWNERYNLAATRERGELDRFRQDHPALAMGTEVAGAVVPSLAIPGSSATTLTGRVALGTGTGTGQGFTYGFNAGEGGFADRVNNATVPAAVGAGFGAAAPLVGAGARAYAQSGAVNSMAREAGLSPPAYKVLQRAFAGDDSLTPAGLQRFNVAGPDAMLADVGPMARDTLDATMQSGGPGVRVAREAVEARAGRANDQLTGALDEAFGVPGQSQSRALVPYGDRRNPLDVIYQRAYAKPIDYSGEAGRRIETLVRDRVPAEAINAANRLMRVEGHKSAQILAGVADDGTVTFRTMPDVRQIDYITRGLNEVADQADGAGKLGGTTQTGRAYGNLSRELRNELKAAVPEYRAALNSAAGLIREGKAREFGEVVLSSRTTRADVLEMVSDMGEAELRKVREGIRQQIDDTLANVKRTISDPNVEAREAMAGVTALSSRATREKVAAIIGHDAADRFYGQLERAATALELRAGVANNSRTAVRQTVNQQMKAVSEGGLFGAIREGQPASWQQRLATALLRRSDDSKVAAQDELGLDLARALTGPNGAQTLQQLTANQGRAQLTGERARILAELLAGRNAGVTAPAVEGFR